VEKVLREQYYEKDQLTQTTALWIENPKCSPLGHHKVREIMIQCDGIGLGRAHEFDRPKNCFAGIKTAVLPVTLQTRKKATKI